MNILPVVHPHGVKNGTHVQSCVQLLKYNVKKLVSYVIGVIIDARVEVLSVLISQQSRFKLANSLERVLFHNFATGHKEIQRPDKSSVACDIYCFGIRGRQLHCARQLAKLIHDIIKLKADVRFKCRIADGLIIVKTNAGFVWRFSRSIAFAS